MAKVLIVTGDAAEDLEVMYPYQRLLEGGYDVDIAAPSRKRLQFVVHDFVDRGVADRQDCFEIVDVGAADELFVGRHDALVLL